MFITEEEAGSQKPASFEINLKAKMFVTVNNITSEESAFMYRIYLGDKVVKERRDALRNSNYHRTALFVLLEILIEAAAFAGKKKLKTLVTLETPALNVYYNLSKGVYLGWRKNKKGFLVNKRDRRTIKNNDVWNMILYFLEHINLRLTDPKRESQDYKNMVRKVKGHYKKTFPDGALKDKSVPKKVTGRLELSRTKPINRLNLPSAEQDKLAMKKKLKELSKLI